MIKSDIQDNNADENVKGVPGFSLRLNTLFDMAGAPKDTRLAWGSALWGRAPNTIGNWIKKDSPPQRYTTLQGVVADLLTRIPGRYDAHQVIGWLYTGSANPFVTTTALANSEPINHLLQVKIFNRLYQMCLFKEIDFDAIDTAITNRMISVIYWYLCLRQKTGLSDDVKEANFLMMLFIDNLASAKITSS